MHQATERRARKTPFTQREKKGGRIRTPASSIPSVTPLLTAGCPPTLAANMYVMRPVDD